MTSSLKYNEKEFMNSVKAHRCLYDKLDPGFKCKHTKDNAWTEIATKWDISVAQAETTYNNILMVFGRQIGALKETESDISSLKPEYEHLRWLAEHLEQRQGNGTNSNSFYSVSNGAKSTICEESEHPLVHVMEDCSMESETYGLMQPPSGGGGSLSDISSCMGVLMAQANPSNIAERRQALVARKRKLDLMYQRELTRFQHEMQALDELEQLTPHLQSIAEKRRAMSSSAYASAVQVTEDNRVLDNAQSPRPELCLEATSDAEGSKAKKPRRWWRSPRLQDRSERGFFHSLMEQDESSFYNYTRMTHKSFEHLHDLVKEQLRGGRASGQGRSPIDSKEKLALTVHLLATGNSQLAAADDFHLGRSTVCKIIKQTCAAIWKALSEEYVKLPSTNEEWKRLSAEFYDAYGLPHMVGAIDGRHLVMHCKYSDSDSPDQLTLLLAISDANYRFIYADICTLNRHNDQSLVVHSKLRDCLANNTLGIPSPAVIHEQEMPYFLAGNESFSLEEWLMTPYPTADSIAEEVYNYRLNRCRRVIDNAFGVLAARWRIFSRPIRADATTTDLIIRACIGLHNFLISTENGSYIPLGFVDSESPDGLTEGEWRHEVKNDTQPAMTCPAYQVNNTECSVASRLARKTLTDYVNSDEGSHKRPWQLEWVQVKGELQDS